MRPVVLFPLSGDFNYDGLYHRCSMRWAAPARGFGRGGSRHRPPGEFREVEHPGCGRGLWWSWRRSRWGPEASPGAHRGLRAVANRTTGQAAVILPTALAGIETVEVAYRMDGLPLVLKQLVPSAPPPDHQVLTDLDRLIGGK